MKKRARLGALFCLYIILYLFLFQLPLHVNILTDNEVFGVDVEGFGCAVADRLQQMLRVWD